MKKWITDPGMVFLAVWIAVLVIYAVHVRS